MASKSGIDNDQELVQEFSELIKTIAKEVTSDVVGSTALQEIRKLNEELKQVRSNAPKVSKSINEAESALSSTRTQVQQVLGGFNQELKDQNSLLKDHLAKAEKTYIELSSGSYSMFRKSMGEQTDNILSHNEEQAGNIIKQLTGQLQEVNANSLAEIDDNICKESEEIRKELTVLRNEQANQFNNIMSEQSRQKYFLQDLEGYLKQENAKRYAEAHSLKVRNNWLLCLNILLLGILVVGGYHFLYK